MNHDKLLKLAEYYYKLAKEEPVMTISSDGTKSWVLHNELHREDGPAIEWANGDKEWLINGKRHREDGPAVEFANGDKEWWINGEYHREDGPAVESASGDHTEWYLNGAYHREGGPAVELSNGDKYWYRRGLKHREDGPAVETGRYQEWWYNGKQSPEIRQEIVPVIKSYDPITKIKTYAHEKVDVDWTNTIRDAWIFDLDTLQLDRLPQLYDALDKFYPIAKLEDIESGNI